MKTEFFQEIQECYLVILRRTGELQEHQIDPCFCKHYRCLLDGEKEVCSLNCTKETCKPIDVRVEWKKRFPGIRIVPEMQGGYVEIPRKKEKMYLCAYCGKKKRKAQQYARLNNNFLCDKCAKKRGLIKTEK